MKFRLGLLFLLINLGLSFSSLAETVLIGLEQLGTPSIASFRVAQGSYRVLVNDKEILSKDQVHVVELKLDKAGILLLSNGKTYGPYRELKFRIDEWDSEFRVKSVQPKSKEHIYQDNLIVKLGKTGMVFINEVNIEKYVAGVVESEGGSNKPIEYYKVQSIISRTYMLANKRRHIFDGYHVCDKVHCQVYHGKSRFEAEIPKAAWATKGSVLVDSEIELITAAFHSNCGGRTSDSETIWSKPLSYLKSREDSFCLHQPHSHWEKSIESKAWLTYLEKKHKVSLEDKNSENELLSYFPSEKTRYFQAGDLKIPLTVVRSDWNLKSSFFTIYEDADSVRFTGRGFGHGVGLCQEGAMRMAELGFTYNEIIHFYYKDVHLIQLGVIDFFRDEEDSFIRH